MNKLKFHCLQHANFEGPAYIAEWVQQNGHDISYTKLYENQHFPSTGSFDVLIIMGGSMGANDEDKFHWIVSEKKFISEAIREKKKIIGICLGSQLLASTMGAKVYPNKEKEIGFFPISIANNHKIVEGFPKQVFVFQWHGDTFDLPQGAIHLASSEACVNQAFIKDGHILAIQFHMEVTEESIHEFIKLGKTELTSAPFIQMANEIKEGYRYIPTCHLLLDNLLENFLSL